MKKYKSPLKRKLLQAENLWKLGCKTRDRNQCQYPHQHDDPQILQVDHCFGRNNQWLKYDLSNGTTVCKSINGFKGFKNHGVAVMIDQIVKRREGSGKFEEMRQIAERNAPKKWTIEEVENLIIKLEKEIAFLEIENRKDGTSEPRSDELPF